MMVLLFIRTGSRFYLLFIHVIQKFKILLFFSTYNTFLLYTYTVVLVLYLQKNKTILQEVKFRASANFANINNIIFTNRLCNENHKKLQNN